MQDPNETETAKKEPEEAGLGWTYGCLGLG